MNTCMYVVGEEKQTLEATLMHGMCRKEENNLQQKCEHVVGEEKRALEAR